MKRVSKYDKKNHIRFEVVFTENIVVRFLEALYNKDSISLHWAPTMTTNWLKTNSNEIDDDEFNFQIADVVNLILSYHLFDKLKNPEDIQKTPFIIQRNAFQAMIHIHKELADARKIFDSKFIESYGISDTFEINKRISKKHPKQGMSHA
ncbi:hypothetical protein AAA799E16_00725 [Marine Group I thaumarchaeote SCGC AAA799-E16]|uniref:Uncharacterized protein n=1 Tax=Marine Group I thaumarchaeote SCGC AAA799-E16 TaxID=1502292 RepID=A0A081S6D4_9ARCH|nr:hypothetical protein AAA799E16_00725 [Marine Group I thaumarchaeote SCGC AAA799-E16]